MNDRQARALLMPYLDSELDARTTAEIAAHLEASESTRQRFDDEARLEAWLGESLREDEMPEDVWRGIQLRMGVIKPPVWPRIAAAAAVLLLGGLGWFFATWESNELMRDLASRHGAITTLGAELDIRTEAANDVRAFLSEHGLGSVKVPNPRTFKGHAISIIGARQETVLGVMGVNMLFKCCDDVVSVFVLPKSLGESLPEGLQPQDGGVKQGRTGSLSVETLDRDDYMLSVMSDGTDEHQSMIVALL